MDNILGRERNWDSQKTSKRTGPCQGPSKESEDWPGVSTTANTFLEGLTGAGNSFSDHTLCLSLIYSSTFWEISEEKGKERKKIEITFIKLLE